MFRIFSYARKKREERIKSFLNRTVSHDGIYRCYWQPPLLVFLKSAAVLLVLYKIYTYHTVAGDAIETGFKFFKLAKIFNFDFPGTDFFHNVSFWLFILFFGYNSIFFFLDQFEGLFSSIILNRKNNMLHYIKIRPTKKEVLSFPIDEIKALILKQPAVAGRILNIGTLQVNMGTGDKIVISSVGNARELSAQLTSEI